MGFMLITWVLFSPCCKYISVAPCSWISITAPCLYFTDASSLINGAESPHSKAFTMNYLTNMPEFYWYFWITFCVHFWEVIQFSGPIGCHNNVKSRCISAELSWSKQSADWLNWTVLIVTFCWLIFLDIIEGLIEIKESAAYLISHSFFPINLNILAKREEFERKNDLDREIRTVRRWKPHLQGAPKYNFTKKYRGKRHEIEKNLVSHWIRHQHFFSTFYRTCIFKGTNKTATR